MKLLVDGSVFLELCDNVITILWLPCELAQPRRPLPQSPTAPLPLPYLTVTRVGCRKPGGRKELHVLLFFPIPISRSGILCVWRRLCWPVTELGPIGCVVSCVGGRRSEEWLLVTGLGSAAAPCGAAAARGSPWHVAGECGSWTLLGMSPTSGDPFS